MQIIEKLYTYGISDKKLDKIISKVKKGKIIPNLCLITLPLFQDGILEIYDYNQLLQPYYKSIHNDITVIGITKNKGDANEVILALVQEMYDAGMDFDVKKYLGI